MKSYGKKEVTNKVKIPDKAKKKLDGSQKKTGRKKINLITRQNFGNASPGDM